MFSEASSSSSHPPAEAGDGYWAAREEAAEAGDGYWAAREEAAAQLQAMAARALGEDELSAEQLETNNQLQADEVLALKAIYGDDMVILEDMAGLRCFQTFVRYPVPNGSKVLLNHLANGTLAGTDNYGSQDIGELSYACSLKHLPPVVLTCLLPRSYPSTCAPYFTISAKWLDEAKDSYLCAMLDEIWAELPGQEVVYRWVDWLDSSSWSYISLNDNIIFVPDGTSYVADERAFGRKLPVGSTIHLMQSYNENASQELFLKSLHECEICLSENTGINFVKLPCHHLFCMKCMESHCRIHVKEGNLTMLTCPDTTCRSPLPPSILKSLLGDDCYMRWESFALQKLLDTMPDLVYCPRCDAACLKVDYDAQCPECFFTFCSLCKERRHVGKDCVTPAQKISMLRERHQKYSLSEKQLLKEQREIDELLNVCEVLRNSKQCPSCKMAISKTYGCNKMTCGNCGKFFCYRCNQAISGYDHFWNGNCIMFEDNNQGRWFGVFVDPDDDDDADDDDLEDVQPARLRLYPCPICGRQNEKFGTNNHILCIGCRGHYCALCRKRVWNSGEHYGPRGCRQHTDP